jgi:tartrate dehydrogenase/decarboxylase/D-malate dehydrogenase
MKTYRIAVYPGDGIGVEVTEHTLRLLERLRETGGQFQLETEIFPWGGDYYFEHGRPAPENYLEILSGFDAIFLGAVGDPRRIPDHLTLEPLIGIRQNFDQYACVRPARLFSGVPTPLANRSSGDIDMVVVRENSEGEYIDNGGRFKKGREDEFAVQTALHTRKGITRILEFGFDLARKRRNHLTLITKSNALKYSYVLWDEVFEELAPKYPDIETAKFHIDAAVMNFVRWPDRFDVVVASNLFGDILTDLSGCLVGGLGLAPSANINPERKYPSMFEPVHGSAPDIAGKGIANPSAAFLSAAMMLEWLDLSDQANRIRDAIEASLSAGETTPDLGGKLTGGEFTERVLGRL